MPGNNAVYAGKSRKKPVQKSAKPPPVKTNPSKRHRDRLNGELERLTGMLPFSEEVRGRLDKLSVLRLSVGYLKVKSYFNAALQKHVRSAPLVSANGRNGPSVSLDGVSFSEGDLLLQALNGFVLVVTTDGTIFYTSPTIQDFLGFHQSDVVHQNVHELVHTEDREMFRCQLHFALKPGDSRSDVRAQETHTGLAASGKAASGPASSLPQYVPPENSSFLDRSFCCRLRCLLDNNSGFLALNFNGRLKYLHSQGGASPPQLALFALATPLQPPAVMAIRTKTLIFQTKHRMDFAPKGIDTRGKLVLGYTETELVTTGSGYQFIHAADMMYCADNHLRMMKTGDSGFTYFRLLTKAGRWLWVQANARVVFKGGRPDFIIARQRSLTNEEGEEHLHQRRRQLPFNLATGEGVLYDVSCEAVPGAPGAATEKPLDPASLLGSLRRQDRSVYTRPPQEPGAQLPLFAQLEDPAPERPQSPLDRAFLDSHALLSVPGQTRGSRSITGDLTSESMLDSLEQILGDIADGGLEGLGVEATELRDWESTVARLSDEREDVSRELDHILANDVFSYVEEALRRETAQGPRPGGAASSSDEWRRTADAASSAERAPFGYSGRDAPRGHASFSPWPAGQTTATQPRHAAATQHSRLQSADGIYGGGGGGYRPGSDQTVQYTLTGSQQTLAGPQHHNPPAWQQFDAASHSSHAARSTGSCMYEKRPNGPLPGPSCSRGTANVPLGTPGGDVGPGMMMWAAPGGRTDVGNVSSGAARPEFAPGSGTIQSSFFCWSGEAQISKVSLNGVVDPFAFSALPTGSVNLPQNSGP